MRRPLPLLLPTWLLLASAGAVLAVPAPARAEAVALDLEEALRLAREHSRTLRDRGDELRASGHRRREAWGRVGPKLSLSARYSRLSHVDPATISLPFSLPGQPPPEPITLGESVENQWGLRLQLDQPLFTGFAISSGIEAAGHGEEAARERLRLAEAEVRVRVEESYLTLLKARQLHDVAGDAERLLERLLADGERRLEAGVSTSAELARTRARLASARLDRVQTGSAIELAQASLASLLGLPAGSELTVAELPPAEAELEESAALEARALARRPELAVAAAVASAKEAQGDAAAAGLWPQLALRAGYSYDRPNARYFPPQDRFDPSWDVSAILGWTLWDFGVSWHGSRAAELEAAVAARAVDEQRDLVRLDVARRRAEVAAIPARLLAAEEAVVATEASLRRAQELCNAGASSCTAVLDAEAELTRARAARVQARADARLAQTLLRRATGGA